MKKLIVAILAIIYISSSTGAVLHLHYCMGELADWSVTQNNDKTCGKCGMDKSEEKDNGCCKDEFKLLKNDTDQKASEVGFKLLQTITIALPVSYIEIPSPNCSCFTEQNPVSHAPPRSAGVAVYIRNCVFLI